MQVKTANVSPPPLCSNPSPYSNYSHYSSHYNSMDLGYFPPTHSMTQPPNYSSHYMSGSNFFRPPSLSSANTMAEYDSYNEKYQVGITEQTELAETWILNLFLPGIVAGTSRKIKYK